MPEILLMGWNGSEWIKLQCDTNGLVKVDLSEVKLDDLATPDDNTDLNATNARHGLLRKLINDVTKFLRSDGAWAVPLGNGNGVTIVRKTVNESVTNSTTMQDDDELLLAVGANEVWLFEFYLLAYHSANGKDIKLGFSYPSGCSIEWGTLGQKWDDVAAGVTGTTLLIEGNTISVDLYTQANWTVGIKLIAVVKNGATPGDVNLQFAQNTAGVGTSTSIKANSSLIAHQLA